MALTNKRRVFIEEYLKCWNASEAARRAGYKKPGQQGHSLLKIVEIQEVIQTRINEIVMETDEIQKRYSDIARGDISDFMDIERMSFSLNLHKAKELELFDNIRIIHQPPYSPEVNPVEHLWEHIREKYFRNGFWLTMDELENDLINALIEVSKSKETIQKLVGFHWTIF